MIIIFYIQYHLVVNQYIQGIETENLHHGQEYSLFAPPHSMYITLITEPRAFH